MGRKAQDKGSKSYELSQQNVVKAGSKRTVGTGVASDDNPTMMISPKALRAKADV